MNENIPHVLEECVIGLNKASAFVLVMVIVRISGDQSSQSFRLRILGGVKSGVGLCLDIWRLRTPIEVLQFLAPSLVRLVWPWPLLGLQAV